MTTDMLFLYFVKKKTVMVILLYFVNWNASRGSPLLSNIVPQ